MFKHLLAGDGLLPSRDGDGQLPSRKKCEIIMFINFYTIETENQSLKFYLLLLFSKIEKNI